MDIHKQLDIANRRVANARSQKEHKTAIEVYRVLQTEAKERAAMLQMTVFEHRCWCKNNKSGV